MLTWRGTRMWLQGCSRRLPMRYAQICTLTRRYPFTPVWSLRHAASSHGRVARSSACILPAPLCASVYRCAYRFSSLTLPSVSGRTQSLKPGDMVGISRSRVIVPAFLCHAWHAAAVQQPHPDNDINMLGARSIVLKKRISEQWLEATYREEQCTLGGLPASSSPLLRRVSCQSSCFSTPSRDFSTFWSGCPEMTEDTADTTIRAAIELLSKDIQEEITNKRERLRVLRQRHGKEKIGDVTFHHVVGGMRGLTALLTETSSLDPHNGITYRGYTVKDLIEKLPRFANEEYPPVEGAMWLLLTGKIPTAEQAQLLSAALNALSCSSPPPSATAASASASPRAAADSHFIPHHTHATLEALPPSTHPMTQLVAAVATLQPTSRLAAAYHQGTRKDLLWKSALYDALSAIAKTAVLAARIYHRSFHRDLGTPVLPRDLDWGARFAAMLGLKHPDSPDLIRLYMLLHADHEGGNVSAHAAHLVGSALSDIYLSATAGLAGLAGPLHGLANQECLKWLQEASTELAGREPAPECVRRIAQRTLDSGRVIPGYGHAVLRVTDPRFLLQREFALKHLKDNQLFRLLDVAHKVIPDVLLATGKVQNPYPNVDCHSGVLLHHYNLTESQYYTVLFGVARTIGIAAQHVLSRGLLLPIERPKSITIEQLEDKVKDSV